MGKDLKIKIEIKETNYHDTEKDRLLEILKINGYYDEHGRWHDPEK